MIYYDGIWNDDKRNNNKGMEKIISKIHIKMYKMQKSMIEHGELANALGDSEDAEDLRLKRNVNYFYSDKDKVKIAIAIANSICHIQEHIDAQIL